MSVAHQLFCPWGIPGTNTGVGCHFLFQGTFQLRDRTHVSLIGRRWACHLIWATHLPLLKKEQMRGGGGNMKGCQFSSSFNFMAAVTIYSDFGARKLSLSLFPLFPHLFAMKSCDQMTWSSFFECWVLSQLFHSPFSLSSRVYLVSLHFLP